MLCCVAIGYIYWLINTTVLRLAFNSRMVLGKKLLWWYTTDVLAYIVRGSPLAAALVVGMFVGLVFIKSSYALINELWFSSFAKSLSRRECLVFPRLAARVSRFKPSKCWCYAVSAFEFGNKSNSIMLYHLKVVCDILQVGVPDSSSIFHM